MLRRNFAMNVHGCFQRTLFTPSPSSPLQIPSPMETHLWYVLPEQVKSPSLMTHYSELLSECERDRVLGIRSDEFKKSALISRALVRTTLARYTNSMVDPKSLKFRTNIFGKPEVDWETADWKPPPLQFNISHTSSLIACGVTTNAQIGVDVEEKSRKIKSDVLAFARRYFSSHESERLSSIPDPEIRRREFVKLWTLKEAYVKALGRGFSASPFSTFTVRIGSTKDLDTKASEITVESSDDPNIVTSCWQFTLLELASSHYAAICVEKFKLAEGNGCRPMKLTVHRTIPFVEEECITDLTQL